ncbi:hypothetical protein [Leucobacter aridicollis]|uniref:hypothetical protein n=1 Tax=Leucobacter aridicollis TaxID=283878 RepID=UPI00216A2131|nr:hypothetical protein [Leucobacter aridicollis]MCS3428864.1 antibiotic biosynthesis monooxygenase (ABM) superfamily enzyme [Leucobacter aridicollis]
MTQIPLLARLVITWLAIFPLVAAAQVVLQPLLAGVPQLLVTAVVMTAVVPVAVTWAVPALSRAYLALATRRTRVACDA